jgi:iron(III) transport system substrate-binding protein
MSVFRLRNRWVSTLSGTVCIALLAAGCGGGSSSDGKESSGRLSLTAQAACDAGETEGALDYWSRTDPDIFAKEVVPFQKAHPKIKVKYTSIRPADATQRVVAEAQAGKLSLDATTTDLPSAAPLFQQKLVRDVDFQKLGVADNLIQKQDGVETFRVFRDFLGLGYNPQKTPESTLPTTWDELVSPQWKGKVIVDPRGTYLGVLAAAWGKDKTMAWFDKFVKTDKPQSVQGTTDSLVKVVSGEAAITTSATVSAIIEQQKAGAPVALHYLDVVSSQDKFGLIMKNAAHPNAAACFLSWWGSAEGQAQQEKYEFKVNADSSSDVPASAKIAFVTTPADQDVVTTVTNEMSQILSQ